MGVSAWLLYVSICLLASGSAVQAETEDATLRIIVRDPSGHGMKVSGRLHNLSAGSAQEFETDRDGKCTFSNLRAGRYRVEVTKTGFATHSFTLELESGAAVSRVFTMALAPVAEKIDVIANTPLPGTDLPIEDIPAPVQTASARDIARSGSLNLSDFLNRRLQGVHINENQGNPFQPDVNYRGYTASSLLGTPEGISVYLDGVRQNQPFGDIVAWDLIPKIAISEMALMPGSNPLFGLNTLGGAISIQTKDGYSQPGGTLQLSGGNFGRRAGEFEYGGSNASGLSWYAAGNLFREDGWRQFSPSEVRQAFGKLGWVHGNTSLGLSFGYADNWLTGNGLQDTRFLARDYTSVYTIPDYTWNRSPSLILNVRHAATNSLTLSGNAYFRYIRADTTNGDINNDSFDQSLYNLSPADIRALNAAGYRGFPTTGNSLTQPFPYWRCIAQGLEKDEPSEKCTGLLTNTYDKQNNWGLSAQASWLLARNHFTAGGAWNRSTLSFQQGSQFGYLNSDALTITPINSFADGSTTQDGVPADTRVNLHGRANTFSFYASDTLNLSKSLAVTVSGRYNRTSVNNQDRLQSDLTGARGSLNGQYVFDRFNPAVGLTYSPFHFLSAYFSYSEASRAPTAVELGCADPAEPCNLPNALVSDPPLKQVLTRTVEAGVRSAQESRVRWSAGWFRAENFSDLLFVASQQTGFGYFTNFGNTRRNGAEVDVSTRIRQLTVGGNYTFLNATYQSAEIVNGGSNSSNTGGSGLPGSISLLPGDQIPSLPSNLLKAYADYQPTPKVLVDVNFVATGRSYARGNENNLSQPDGTYYVGQGFSPGYGVLNVGGHYQFTKRVQLFVQINNVLDHRYYTAAQLGPTPYDYAKNFMARPFAPVGGDYPIRHTTYFAPGAPVGAWAGIRFRF
ncbi:MAG: TonB-dependent receptor [Bryobacteraceae bacterium]